MTGPAPSAPDRLVAREPSTDEGLVPRSGTRAAAERPLSPASTYEDPAVRPASLEGFGKRLETIHGSSLSVAFRIASEISKALAPRAWGLFLRLGDDAVFRYASGAGFKLPPSGGMSIDQAMIDAWPISHRAGGSSLDALRLGLASATASGFRSLDALRFGDRALYLSDRPIEPRPSGTLEAAFAALGARLDPGLGRVLGMPERLRCSAAELGRDLSRKMRMMGASHLVLASFDASGIRKAMKRDFDAEPDAFMSLVDRVASSLLSETGGACVSPDSRLAVYMLTRSPPDPELLAAQFATSLSRALGGFDRSELPILGFLSVRSDEQGLEGYIETFLGSMKPRP